MYTLSIVVSNEPISRKKQQIHAFNKLQMSAAAIIFVVVIIIYYTPMCWIEQLCSTNKKKALHKKSSWLRKRQNEKEGNYECEIRGQGAKETREREREKRGWGLELGAKEEEKYQTNLPNQIEQCVGCVDLFRFLTWRCWICFERIIAANNAWTYSCH